MSVLLYYLSPSDRIGYLGRKGAPAAAKKPLGPSSHSPVVLKKAKLQPKVKPGVAVAHKTVKGLPFKKRTLAKGILKRKIAGTVSVMSGTSTGDKVCAPAQLAMLAF